MADHSALSGNPGETSTTRVDDVLFATEGGVPLHADLYLPRHTDGRPVPVIVWVHGGAWRVGDRRLAPDLSRFFAARGFAMASIDYRLSTQAQFPAPVHDVKTAVRWLRSVAPVYSFDRDRIGLWGSSSGGHLAALAALSEAGVFESAASPYAAYPSAVQAFADGYGPTDFLQMDAHRPPDGTPSDDPESMLLPAGLRSALADSPESRLLGAPIETCPERVREANPITYARAGAPPGLILHGACDTTVPVHQSVLLYEALAAHDNRVSLTIVDGLGHGFLNRSHLDDGPARGMTTRTHVPGRGEQLVREPGQVFGLVEGFFREVLRGDA
jgi:acetyl esterase/lipase